MHEQHHEEKIKDERPTFNIERRILGQKRNENSREEKIKDERRGKHP